MHGCETLQKPIFFALHHKCGNVYFRVVLREFIKQTSGYHFLEVAPTEIDQHLFTGGTITRLRNFTLQQLHGLPEQSRIVACIRDPRSLIVSCTDYHMRGDEEWTQVPAEKFGGLSYSEYLAAAVTDEQRFIISMEHNAGHILRRMKTFAGSQEVLVVKLEDLSRDESCKTYQDIAQYLELPDDDRELFTQILINHSLWKIKLTTGKLPTHSTSGVSNTGLQRLKGQALEKYRELFGDLHLEMGYED